MSHGSIGSLNVSAGGYGSDFGPSKSGAASQPESILQDVGPSSKTSGSSGGVEDLKNWL